MDRFFISATGHSLNYLPQYMAEEQGFFREEGLEVSEIVPSPWDRVLEHIRDGSAEAALGGIWVPSMYHGRGRRLVPFAQVSNRAPLALVARSKPQSGVKFDAGALVGKTVLMKGSNGASVGIYLKMMLREAGVDPKTVNYIQDLDGGILKECFAGGMGDYLLIDLPGAMAYEAAGHGAVATIFAVDGGDIPWSVYYTEPLDPGDTRPARFCRAIGRGMEWLNTHEASTFKDFLKRTFPTMDCDICIDLVNLYRAKAMWTSPHIGEASFARWQEGITAAHLIDAPIDYDVLNDNSHIHHFTPERAL